MSRSIGIALDIDGVLLRGKKVLPMATEAVQMLRDTRIPFIFLTNGGGVSEEQKALELSTKLDIQIPPHQVLLSHTPMKTLLPKYENKNILILGHDDCYKVAKSYGFHHACNIHAVHASCPDAWPRRIPNSQHGNVNMASIAAIVNFHDPLDWALEMQIVSDIIVENSHVEYYSCNADVTYSGAYHRPRYTQGAFNTCLQHILMKAFNIELKINNFGKPYHIQYQFAENMLAWEAHNLKLLPPTVYFGIGDNPKADIRGANNAGDAWKSVLVRTGVWSDSAANDYEDPADLVADDVLDAVRAIIKMTGKA